MSDGILCQVCGIEAPLKHVTFNQNVGMLITRRRTYVKGNLCKRCVHAEFWKKTGTTIAVGWLGRISVFIAPVFVVGNVVSYISSLRMPAVPPDARHPVLDQPSRDKLSPFYGELMQRLNGGEFLAPVARDMAPRIGVTPGQFVLYVQWVLASMRQQQLPQEKTYGFPVLPVATAQGTTSSTPAPVPLPPLPPAQANV